MKRWQIIFGIIGSVAQIVGLLMIAVTAFAARTASDSPHSLISENVIYVGSNACFTCHSLEHDEWSLTLHPIAIQDVVNNPTVLTGNLITGEQERQVEIGSGTRPHAADNTPLMDNEHHQRYIMRTDDGFLVLSSHMSSETLLGQDASSNGWLTSCENCHTGESDLEVPTDVQINQSCEACHVSGSPYIETTQVFGESVSSVEDPVSEDSG